MSAVLQISENTAWAPSASPFEIALEWIAYEIQREEPELSSRLLRIVEWQETFADFSQVSPSTFQAVLRAVKRIMLYLLDDKPERYPNQVGIIWPFNELKAMLLLDPRSGYVPAGTGSVLVNDHATWQTVEWMYDLAFEIVIQRLRFEQVLDLAAKWVNQWKQGARVLDLRELDQRYFRIIFQSVEQMQRLYGDAGRRVMLSEVILNLLAPRIVELHEIFRNDVRCANH